MTPTGTTSEQVEDPFYSSCDVHSSNPLQLQLEVPLCGMTPHQMSETHDDTHSTSLQSLLTAF